MGWSRHRVRVEVSERALRAMVAAGVAAWTILGAGCADDKIIQTTTTLRPADFVRDGGTAVEYGPAIAAAEPAGDEAVTLGESGAGAEPAGAVSPPENGELTGAGHAANGTAEGSDRVMMDAMVGQVHRQNIYASAVFKQLGEESLIARGKAMPRLDFRRQVGAQIFQYLNSMVMNEKIIEESEADLTDQERMGLVGMVQMERETVIRQYGGTLWQAEQGLMQDYGLKIDEYLERKRKELLARRWYQEKYSKFVTVSRREVERYYRDNIDQYMQPESITGRVIMVNSASDADLVDRELGEGKSFEEVAKKRSEIFKADGGLMQPFQEGHGSLRWEELNVAFAGAEVGRHSERITLEEGKRFGWVYVEKREGGKQQTLADVFLEIENHLRVLKLNTLQRQEQERLMRDGGYTDIEVMTSALVEVAMARYASPQ